MVKSKLVSPQGRYQECMKSATLAVLPLGSKEMNALQVYVSSKSNGYEIAVPGLKR